MKVSYSDLYSLNKNFETNFIEKVKEIFQRSEFVGGKHIEEFESKFADYTNNLHCVSTSSGTDSLSIIVRSLDLDPMKDVIYYPANTFIGTILGPLQMGFKCKPYDVNIDTFNVDDNVLNQIGEDAKVVIVVHLYGYGNKSITKIQNFCNEKQIHLIEDCSQSHFQTIDDKQVSNFGIASFFSMYPGKNFGAAGQAGAIVTNDEHLCKKMKAIRNYGADKKYEHNFKGSNYRMDSIQAAFLNLKFDVMKSEIDYRRFIANEYMKNLNKDIIKFMNISCEESVWHIFPVIPLKKSRENFIEHLTKHEIETVIHYPKNIHQFVTWKSQIISADTTNADKISSKVVSIPCHGGMSKEQIEHVIKVINDFQ